jgi:hypothetical protein
MDTFKATRIGQTYWIEAVSQSGAARLIEAWPSKEAALARLEALQKQADVLTVPMVPRRGR